MEEKKTFTMLRSYYEAAKNIPDKSIQADYLMAILAYGFDEEEVSLTGWAATLFSLVKPNIEANNKRTGRKPQETESDPEVTSKSLLSDPEVTSKSPPHNMNMNMNMSMSDEEGGMKQNDPPKAPPAGGKSSGGMSAAQEQAFDQFWAVYPKKKSKGQARKAWSKINPSRELFTAIMDKLQQLKNSYDWKKDRGQYIPYPATWLNAEGWNDEVSASPPKRNEPHHENPFLELLQEEQARELSTVDDDKGGGSS